MDSGVNLWFQDLCALIGQLDQFVVIGQPLFTITSFFIGVTLQNYSQLNQQH